MVRPVEMLDHGRSGRQRRARRPGPCCRDRGGPAGAVRLSRHRWAGDRADRPRHGRSAYLRKPRLCRKNLFHDAMTIPANSQYPRKVGLVVLPTPFVSDLPLAPEVEEFGRQGLDLSEMRITFL